ncbi:peptidoglycan editing factor PgeF [Dyella sp. KRB-257]|uniref:peptidoglycan editing factor PgeF n=1 Tax=Dyella sp. KRB-257 TaxID=3400915 RepID=UPI003C0E4DEE
MPLCRDDPAWVVPGWPAPPGVCAAVSTRQGPGVSVAPFDRFNLGMRSGDDPAAVAANRAALQAALDLPHPPHWLQQVHGTGVCVVRDAAGREEPIADAAITRECSQPLAILTADCLPVLLCDAAGSVVGAAHAGWRGLAAGVIERTVAAMAVDPARVRAWLGPCIGLPSYEVGEEVRAAFVDTDPGAASRLVPTRPGHWRCDLAALARRRLATIGVTQVAGGGFDTFTDARFYSYRRDGVRSGRFASLIWLEDAAHAR